MFYNIYKKLKEFFLQALKKLNFLSRRMTYNKIHLDHVDDQKRILTQRKIRSHIDSEPILANYLRKTADLKLQLELFDFNDEMKAEHDIHTYFLI